MALKCLANPMREHGLTFSLVYRFANRDFKKIVLVGKNYHSTFLLLTTNCQSLFVDKIYLYLI